MARIMSSFNGILESKRASSIRVFLLKSQVSVGGLQPLKVLSCLQLKLFLPYASVIYHIKVIHLDSYA